MNFKNNYLLENYPSSLILQIGTNKNGRLISN